MRESRARARLFHAVVGLGLGVAMGTACANRVEQAADGATGSGGGGGGPVKTSAAASGGGFAAATSTVASSSTATSSSSGTGGSDVDAGAVDAAPDWFIVPIK
jgi:hypothetical protein